MRTLVGAIVLVVGLGGCATGQLSSNGGAPSSDASASAEAHGALTSAVYPYAMTWPPDELESRWRPADTAWDGTSRIDHGNEYTDYVRTADGHLFAFGHETGKSAEEFESLIAEQAAEWHGCDATATAREPLTVGGADGILATYRCGPTTVLRWVGVRQGLAMAVILLVADDADVDAARARFTDRLAGSLTWTS